MKMKSLGLGIALGFLAVVSSSCSPQTCSTANCDGCCQGNMCVARPANGNNTTCGTSGNACVNCAASNSTCDSTTFTCGTGTGGGTAGGMAGGTGGGGVACDGCRLAAGTCVRRGMSQNNNICGSNGDSCRACTGTATPICANGVCVAQQKQVGSTCSGASGCETVAPTAVCKQRSPQTMAQDVVQYPGGMCTIENCDPARAASCPADSACAELPVAIEPRTFCAPTCADDAECTTKLGRSGYECWAFGPNRTSVCLPAQLLLVDQYDPADNKVGRACDNNATCSGPPEFGAGCFFPERRTPDGGIALGRDGGVQPTGFAGGYCSRDCTSDIDCVAGNMANYNEAYCIGVCVDSCTGLLSGQGSCRPGYVCDGIFTADGGVLRFMNGDPLPGFCWPNCNNPGFECPVVAQGSTTRRRCLPSGYCESATVPYPVTLDAGSAVDAGAGPDAGTVTDAGTTADGGTATDAGTTADAGTATDAGSTTCPDGGAVGADGGC